jgi:hypothetical protein
MLIQRSLVEAECRTRQLAVNPPELSDYNMETVGPALCTGYLNRVMVACPAIGLRMILE